MKRVLKDTMSTCITLREALGALFSVFLTWNMPKLKKTASDRNFKVPGHLRICIFSLSELVDSH